MTRQIHETLRLRPCPPWSRVRDTGNNPRYVAARVTFTPGRAFKPAAALVVNMSGTAADEDAEHRDEETHEDVDTSHLDEVNDGCGCTEVWEHLSEERASEE